MYINNVLCFGGGSHENFQVSINNNGSFGG